MPRVFLPERSSWHVGKMGEAKSAPSRVNTCAAAAERNNVAICGSWETIQLPHLQAAVSTRKSRGVDSEVTKLCFGPKCLPLHSLIQSQPRLFIFIQKHTKITFTEA